MEIRKFAERILRTEDLSQKLQRFLGEFTDDVPGEPLRLQKPARPQNLKFAARRTAPPMPKHAAFHEPQKCGVAHHIMANHELQAVEVMASMLCAFPNAPKPFRFGLTNIIDDEQRHTRLHADRAEELGVPFGSLPANSYIWAKSLSFESPLDYLAGLPLTFEGCNLDHTLEFEEAFLQVGAKKSAAVMRVIHLDEIEHVRFGIVWLRKLKPQGLSDWDTFVKHLKWPLKPSKARGEIFHREPRLKAGLTEEFLDRLEAVEIDIPH